MSGGDPAFWMAAWEEGRTPFHAPMPHPTLVGNADRWLGAEPRRVFVPLCGRSHDLAWLAGRGHHAIGAELSPRAVEGLFADAGRARRVDGDRWSTERLDVFVGDVFALTPDRLEAAWSVPGPVHVWDRAALVALPPDLRPRYAAHLLRLAGPDASFLVETMAYDQAKMPGPPYSVPDDEIRALFPGHACERLATAVEAAPPRFRERGLDQSTRSLTLLSPR